jgi:hypothetical protein
MTSTNLPARRDATPAPRSSTTPTRPALGHIELPTRYEADGTQSLSLLAMLDAVTGPPTPAELAKARTLLTQRFGAVPDEQWSALTESIARRGWSADRFKYAVRRVLEQPFKKWNLADFGDAEPRNDIQLRDYAWVQQEVAKDHAAMLRMQGYAIDGTTVTWWRYADASPLPTFCRLIFDRGSAFAAADEDHDATLVRNIARAQLEEREERAEEVHLAVDVTRQLIEANAELAALRAEIERLATENAALHEELRASRDGAPGGDANG